MNLFNRIMKAIEDGIIPNMSIAACPSSYTPPAAGLARARLVGYFELGKHEEEFEGRKNLRDKVDLVFELSGPNHEPRKLDDGTVIPDRITVQETLSFSENANFFKLFAAMNAAHGSTATHMAQLLGKPFMVEVFHRKSKDGKKVYANLKGPNGYNVRGTVRGFNGQHASTEVPLPFTAIRAFIWAIADEKMWDSIYIPGMYEEKKDAEGKVIAKARSKNVLQERIMQAVNWKDHGLSKIVG